MDTNKIKVLLQAVESGSLLTAASKLGYTQAGLSHMMNSLENELGITLLQRGKFGVRLTKEGHRLLPLLQELITVSEKIKTEADSILEQKASVIRLSAIASVIKTWLPDTLLAFQNENPGISFEIKEADDRLYQWFDQGLLDLCITSNIQNRRDFIPLMTDDFFAVLPPDYPLAENEVFPLCSIEHENFLFPSCASDYDVQRLLTSYGIHLNRYSAFVDDSSAVSMVARGFGITLLPKLVLDSCRENIKTAPLDLPCCRRIGIIYDQGKNTSSAVRKFVSFLKQTFSAE